MADSFFKELKRRNVFKVGVAYLVLAWVVIQVTSEAVPALHLPEWVNSAVFFPDGRILATTGNDGTVRFWDVTTQEPLKTLSAGAPVRSMTISPDGATLATASVDNTIQLWDTSKQQFFWQGKGFLLKSLKSFPVNIRKTALCQLR